MGRLIIVSNRLPVTASLVDGALEYVESVGGLATGLASVYREYDGAWAGWPGLAAETLTPEKREELDEYLLDSCQCLHVPLEERDLEEYYDGFSNKTIWPLFHYFTQYTRYEEAYWERYVHANRVFADTVLSAAGPDDLIWIHDYHLMLLPEMIRQRLPEATIGFFLHIPFPSFETFRLLPWRLEVLTGLLGADLVGFHTFDYAKHFLASVRNLVGHEHNAGVINAGRRIIRVDAFPMGIDYERYSEAPSLPAATKAIEKLKGRVGKRRIILSIDRLDYSKGIVKRIEAVDAFLEKYPEYVEKVQVIVVAVPSRTDVEEYERLKRKVDEMVGRINGRHGTIGWNPIEYLYSSVPFEELIALYHLARVCLVTPLRDGMNLIAKEFVAANDDDRGVLVLSEMAGAAKELGEAIIVNPNNKHEVASAIRNALEMPQKEKSRRANGMRQRLQRYGVTTWAADFIDSLGKVKAVQDEMAALVLDEDARDTLAEDYRGADRRVLFLDYEGTLVDAGRRSRPSIPDAEVIELLRALAADSANTIVLMSGRNREVMDEWLGGTGVDMVAEHGGWTRKGGAGWEPATADPGEWKAEFRPMFELFADRTPGASFVEKDFSLVWYYRRADPELAALRALELKDAAISLSTHLNLTVLEGNRVLEVRDARVDEGQAASRWLDEKPRFVLAVGDDWTDEDLFAALPDTAYSIRVGFEPSRAKWNVESVGAVRDLLRHLID